MPSPHTVAAPRWIATTTISPERSATDAAPLATSARCLLPSTRATSMSPASAIGSSTTMLSPVAESARAGSGRTTGANAAIPLTIGSVPEKRS